MPRETALSASQNNASPDYAGLVSFLLEPFLEDPKTLSIHCEQVASTKKLWLRVAFDTNDKGKVFGRGGRNIKAIRTVLNTAATNVNQQIYLDIYGTEDLSSNGKSFSDGNSPGRRNRNSNFDRNNSVRRRGSRERPSKPTKPIINS
ncbi:MAG: KH domain-containing protein [Cyanobacteria bacterium P01_F01_bin.143]